MGKNLLLGNKPGHNKLAATFVASTLVVLLGFIGLYRTTEGGASFTTETRRRIQIEKQAHDIKPLKIIDQSGNETQLDTLFKSHNKIWVVDFIYTRCQAVCLALGSQYQQLQNQIKQRGLEDRVGLLSVSFDPTNDNAPALQRYAERMRADPTIWKIVSLSSASDKSALLDEFGIMVITAPLGEYEHNGAFLLVNSQAKLIKILDYQDTKQLLDVSLHLAKQ